MDYDSQSEYFRKGVYAQSFFLYNYILVMDSTLNTQFKKNCSR